MSTKHQLLPIGQAARLLGVSVDTMRRLGRLGRIPEYRDHRGVRHYRRDDIEKLRRERTPRLRPQAPTPKREGLA